MPSVTSAGPVLAGLLMVATAALGCRRDSDLTRAIAGPRGDRVITSPNVRLDSVRWLTVVSADSNPGPKAAVPRAICWRGDSLVVADAITERLLLFNRDGRLIRTVANPRSGSGRFADLAVVRCGALDGAEPAFLIVDTGVDQVFLLDASGHLIYSDSVPVAPQIDVVGDFVLARTGEWFDCWLGSRLTIGPYLSPAEWQKVQLVRKWSPAGAQEMAFGKPVPYKNTVARRVLNRSYMTLRGDSIWVLLQGSATLIGFDVNGKPLGAPTALPIYYRGKEPTYSVKKPLSVGEEFRTSRMLFDPNVAGLALVKDTLFAVIRYRDWGWRHLGSGIGHLGRSAQSAVEIFERNGKVLRAYAVPGFASEIASNSHDAVAVITSDPQEHRAVLMSWLP